MKLIEDGLDEVAGQVTLAAENALPTSGQEQLADVELKLEVEDDGHRLREGEWVVSAMAIHEALSEAAEANLRLESADLTADERKLHGRSVVLTIVRPGVGARRFAGIVDSVVSEGAHEGRRRLARVRVVPAVQLLALNRRWRRFLNMSAPDILAELLAPALNHWRRAVEFRLSRENEFGRGAAAYLVREFTAQRGESDWDFARRIAADEGLTFFFDHSTEAETLVLTDHNVRFPRLGRPLSWVPATGQNQHEECFARFELATQTRATSAVVSRFDLTRPQALLTARQQCDGNDQEPPELRETCELTGPTLGRFDGDVYTACDTKSQTQVHLEAARTAETVGNGTSNVVGLGAGTVFSLKNDPVGRGEYAVIALWQQADVSHHADGGPSTVYGNEVTCVPADRPFRPTRLQRPSASFDFAEVVAVADDDPIHHDVLGRIKVRFSWDRDSPKAGADTSAWLPVASPSMGEGRGFQATPRRGDTVLVAYEHGDPDRPIVVASVPTGTNRPLFSPEQKTWLGLRSQSLRPDGQGGFLTNHYNEISMSDEAGSEKVLVRAGHDLEEEILHDARRRIGRNGRVAVAHDLHETVGHHRQSTIGEQEVPGEDHLTVFGKRVTEINGQDELKITKGASVSVEGGRTTAIVGTDKLLVHGPREVTIDETLKTHVRKDALTKVDGEARLTQAGTTVSLHHGKMDITAEGHILIRRGQTEIFIDANDNISIATAKDIAIEGRAVTLKGQTIALEATQSIRLGVGASAMTMESQKLDCCAPSILHQSEVTHTISSGKIDLNP